MAGSLCLTFIGFGVFMGSSEDSALNIYNLLEKSGKRVTLSLQQFLNSVSITTSYEPVRQLTLKNKQKKKVNTPPLTQYYLCQSRLSLPNQPSLEFTKSGQFPLWKCFFTQVQRKNLHHFHSEVYLNSQGCFRGLPLYHCLL